MSESWIVGIPQIDNIFPCSEMDSVEERKKRIEELKRKKAALLAQGKTAENTKPT